MDDKGKSVKWTYFLESDAPNGNATIEAFVQEALALYRKQQSAKVDPSRYMYVPVLSSFRGLRTEGEGDKSSSSVQYKRYKLSEDKSFQSFFHPEKQAILSLVDSFTAKTGKFSIAGYPNKLGFLLYGPPGTGKVRGGRGTCACWNRTACHECGCRPCSQQCHGPRSRQRRSHTPQVCLTCAHRPCGARACCVAWDVMPTLRTRVRVHTYMHLTNPPFARPYYLPADVVHQGVGAIHQALHHQHPPVQDLHKPGADRHYV